MYPLNHTPYLDWLTFGLYWIDRLSDVSNPGRITNEVFSRTTPYRLDVTGNSAGGIDITAFLSDPAFDEVDKWFVLKQLSAALRYSYLDGTLVVFAAVIEDPGLPGHYTVRLDRLSGPCVLLSPLRENECVYNADVVLQGGHPATWFDMDRWNMHEPIAIDAPRPQAYPLSRAMFCDPRYSQPLVRIGASCVSATHWIPPKASATDDMFDYLTAQPPPSAFDEGL